MIINSNNYNDNSNDNDNNDDDNNDRCGLVRPVHLLRVSLLRVLEPNFPGDSL